MTRSDRPNRVPEIKSALTNVQGVLEQLGILGEGRARRRQSKGFLIRCPVHTENTPSCSVQLIGGALLWKCHGCGKTGDVLTLIGAVRGLNMGRDFRQVLAEAARMGGLWHLTDELEGRDAEERRAPVYSPPAPVPEPPREWPPVGEVHDLWSACGVVGDFPIVVDYLRGRGIDPDRVEGADLARVIDDAGALPPWARCRFGSWREAGYRLLLPMFSADGEMRSLRAWRMVAGEGPKRLPPTGHKASGLVMADTFGRAMLTDQRSPAVVAIVEGEPDFLARCQVTSDPSVAVLGIVSGSWHQGFADRIPVGTRVAVRTDNDAAGDRYAAEIIATLKRRAFPFRTKGAA